MFLMIRAPYYVLSPPHNFSLTTCSFSRGILPRSFFSSPPFLPASPSFYHPSAPCLHTLPTLPILPAYLPTYHTYLHPLFLTPIPPVPPW
jgi:hypothetical protein